MTNAHDINAIFRSEDGLIEVGVGELVVAEHPSRLMTPALGSCVGVAIYDPLMKRGGLAHIMLPTAGTSMGPETARFASFAIPEIVRIMVQRGSIRRRLVAKMAGGAAMFRGDMAIASIGERNLAEARRQLDLMSVPLVAEDTGKAHARTVELDLDTGVLVVRSYQFGISRL